MLQRHLWRDSKYCGKIIGDCLGESQDGGSHFHAQSSTGVVQSEVVELVDRARIDT